MKALTSTILVLIFALATSLAAQNVSTSSATLRIKDVTKLSDSKGSQIGGGGLVLGLVGTGTEDDKLAAQMKRDYDRNLGLDPTRKLKDADFANKNIASVNVVGELNYTVTKAGTPFVAVVTANMATSLFGGRLVETQLKNAEGVIYAVASGKVTIDPKTPTQGRVDAVLLKDLPSSVYEDATTQDEFQNKIERRVVKLFLELQDLGTATNIEKAINYNTELTGTVGTTDDVRDAPKIAKANAEGTMIEIDIPKSYYGDEANFINKVQQLTVNVDSAAMIVINESANIVTFTKAVTLIGGNVSVGGLTIVVPGDGQMPNKAQPGDELIDPVVTVNPNDTTSALNDLVQLFQVLNLTADEKRSVIREMHNNGTIRGHLIER